MRQGGVKRDTDFYEMSGLWQTTAATLATMSTGTEQIVGGNADLVERKVTINQLVGYNMAEYRRAARLTQGELGKRLGGWTKVAVSAAEHSWDGKRVRKFDADELVTLARALGVPVMALFLPPWDAGTATRYVLDGPGAPDLTTLLPDILSTRDDDSPPMAAYRKRLMALGARRIGPLERVVMGSLVEQREELERRIDDLRAFEREYRSRLGAYLEGQLSDLRAGAADSGTFPAVSGSATRSAARG